MAPQGQQLCGLKNMGHKRFQMVSGSGKSRISKKTPPNFSVVTVLEKRLIPSFSLKKLPDDIFN